MNQFHLVLVEPELEGDDQRIKARVAELMAPYSSDLLWTEHIAECWRIDCDEPDHVRSRRFAKWDWYVIGGDYDGLVNGDEHPEPATPAGWRLERNIRPVKDLPEDIAYWSILTPDGWFDNPSLYAHPESEVLREWLGLSTRLLGRYPDYLAVGINLHN
jgi:hypothetical protein